MFNELTDVAELIPMKEEDDLLMICLSFTVCCRALLNSCSFPENNDVFFSDLFCKLRFSVILVLLSIVTATVAGVTTLELYDGKTFATSFSFSSKLRINPGFSDSSVCNVEDLYLGLGFVETNFAGKRGIELRLCKFIAAVESLKGSAFA